MREGEGGGRRGREVSCVVEHSSSICQVPTSGNTTGQYQWRMLHWPPWG